MLTYMLDTNICIHVMKNYPRDLQNKFNSTAEQLCISSVTLGELHYGAEKSARRADNLTAIEHFVARLDVLPFDARAAAHYGQLRAEHERAGTPCGPHDMQIGGHARSGGLIVVSNNVREFGRMPGVRVEDWVGGRLADARPERGAQRNSE
jgi:tRNA(fMet)-specific endonuclease VapC